MEEKHWKGVEQRGLGEGEVQLLLGLSPVAKRTPYGQLAGVTGAPGQFPEFT